MKTKVAIVQLTITPKEMNCITINFTNMYRGYMLKLWRPDKSNQIWLFWCRTYYNTPLTTLWHWVLLYFSSIPCALNFTTAYFSRTSWILLWLLSPTQSSRGKEENLTDDGSLNTPGFSFSWNWFSVRVREEEHARKPTFHIIYFLTNFQNFHFDNPIFANQKTPPD